MSHGYSLLASISAARGATRSRTIWRMVSRKSIWSGVSSYWKSAGAVVMDGDRIAGGVSFPRPGYTPCATHLGKDLSNGYWHLDLPHRRRRNPALGRV